MWNRGDPAPWNWRTEAAAFSNSSIQEYFLRRRSQLLRNPDPSYLNHRLNIGVIGDIALHLDVVSITACEKACTDSKVNAAMAT